MLVEVCDACSPLMTTTRNHQINESLTKLQAGAYAAAQ